ncbi:hypothetical protein KUV51_11065 [Tateyamaria omphalii]|uniref:hypothetical protein n=1 Tax=Tateyamaria omphalii TaxID=299262 RepID=UPI001C98FAE5|nr:hypothetical protein [Tateyamaria omphalii]MBY5933540.1 hypothetical protein [Tateyamaria omphalii]
MPDALTFPYPVWSIWRDDLDPATRDLAEQSLMAIRDQIGGEQSEVMAELAGISQGETLEILGNIEEAQ